ncbi:MAG TPA: deoxyribonuclease IV [Chlamydiales bacterium]|nr:deoxyribonuclease IV [Chlamydiales bacterium]
MMKPIWLGAHTSAAGGSFNALYQGMEIGATSIQLFTSNQKQWQGRTISEEEIRLWEKALEETGIREVMSHDSYLINLGSPKAEILHKSREAFREEIERCHLLNIPYLNFHPGAATDNDTDRCIATIIQSLLAFEPLLQKGATRLLMETTAGQGTSVGHRFEHLAQIISGLHQTIPIGVCIDTCHIFVAGYDIRGAGWEPVLEEFDRVIGLSHLFAFHLNDSQKDLGARVDRHAGIGCGKIGLESFAYLMKLPRLRDLPKYLETPVGLSGWKNEIMELRKLAE